MERLKKKDTRCDAVSFWAGYGSTDEQRLGVRASNRTGSCDTREVPGRTCLTGHKQKHLHAGPSPALGTCAALSIRSALHSWWADAHEGANEILAQHSSRLAVVQTLCTLIQICNQKFGETILPAYTTVGTAKWCSKLHCSANPCCLGQSWLANSRHQGRCKSEHKPKDSVRTSCLLSGTKDRREAETWRGCGSLPNGCRRRVLPLHILLSSRRAYPDGHVHS